MQVMAGLFAGAGLGLSGGAAAQIIFTDVTAAAGLTTTYAPSAPMIPGVDEWMLGGVAVADFNNDGWPDIFVMMSGGGPDRLFINNGNGTFTNQAVAWGVAAVHGGGAVCAGDYNGDGWIDLFVASFGSAMNNQGEIGKHRLYRNNGNGTFTEVAVEAGVNLTSTLGPSGNGCCFGDYDLDGRLDLAVAGWKSSAQGNRLFRNIDGQSFTNVTGTAITFPPTTWGFTPAFADMDDDGFPELLLAADFKTSRYYINNGHGGFTDATLQSGTGLDAHGMGQCVGDFNNDGRLDWYVTSIYIEGASPSFYNGNTLYMQTGTPHQYIEVAKLAGVDNGGWGWGSVAIDVDNDGWLDLMEVNGRPAGEWANVRQYLWRNNGDGTFTEVLQQGWGFHVGEGRAVAMLDYDRDGDMDLVMVINNGPLKLYRNDSVNGHNWLQLAFDTTGNPRVPPFGRGARVKARIGETTLLRVLDGGHGYGSSSEDIVHFGLGTATVIDELTIELPPGYVLTLTNVAVNQRLLIEAPSITDLNGDGVVDGADLGSLLGVWGPVSGKAGRVADFNRDGVVDGGDLGTMLGQWGQ